MTDFRTSQTVVGVVADWDPQIQIAQFYAEVGVDADPQLRIAQFYAELAVDANPFARLTQYHLEVLHSLGPPVEEEDLEFYSMNEPIFPSYAPVEYGERWGHT